MNFSRLGSARLRRCLAALALAAPCAAWSADVHDATGVRVASVVKVLAGGQGVLALLAVPGSSSSDSIRVAGFEPSDQVSQMAASTPLVEVLIDAQELRHPYAPFVYFDAADCTGPASLSVSATRPAVDTRAAIVGPQWRVFTAADAIKVLASPASRLDANGCTSYRHRIWVLKARESAALRAGLTPPFGWN